MKYRRGMVATFALMSIAQLSCASAPNAAKSSAEDDGVKAPTIISVNEKVRRCVELAPAGAHASGQWLQASWKVRENGEVESIEVLQNGPDSALLEDCVVDTLKATTFAEVANPMTKHYSWYFGRFDAFSNAKAEWLRDTFGVSNKPARECFESIEHERPAEGEPSDVAISWAIRGDGSTERFALALDGREIPVLSVCFRHILADTSFVSPTQTPGEHRYTWTLEELGFSTQAGREHAGELSRSSVWETIHEHSVVIQKCYEKELVKSPKIAGKLIFVWTVQPDGYVNDVRLKQDTIGEPKVTTCVADVIRQMKFPRPRGGSVEIVFPWIFKAL